MTHIAVEKGRNMIYKSIFSSPLGFIEICSDDGERISRVYFTTDPSETFTESELTVKAKNELNEYFSGERRSFEFAITAADTKFEADIYEEIRKIPYGEQRTIKQLAAAVGDEKAVKDAQKAIERNKLLIIVPTHRVARKKNFLASVSSEDMVNEALLNFEKNILKNAKTDKI